MKQRIPSGRTGPSQGEPVIYLVDDEPLLLDLAEAALQENGWVLKKFRDPEAALSAFTRARPRPGLIVSDYAMGHMNGCDFLAHCKALEPRLKTILVSGTVGPEIVLNAPVKLDGFLPKPYQPKALVGLVRSVLGD